MNLAGALVLGAGFKEFAMRAVVVRFVFLSHGLTFSMKIMNGL